MILEKFYFLNLLESSDLFVTLFFRILLSWKLVLCCLTGNVKGNIQSPQSPNETKCPGRARDSWNTCLLGSASLQGDHLPPLLPFLPLTSTWTWCSPGRGRGSLSCHQPSRVTSVLPTVWSLSVLISRARWLAEWASLPQFPQGISWWRVRFWSQRRRLEPLPWCLLKILPLCVLVSFSLKWQNDGVDSTG